MKTRLMLAALAFAGTTAQADLASNQPKGGTARPAVAPSAVSHAATSAGHGGSPAGPAHHPAAPAHAGYGSTPGKAGPWGSPAAPTRTGGSAPAAHRGTPAAPAQPATTGPGKAAAPRPNYANYHLTHGKVFSGGYCYPGKNHTHWAYHGWSKKYRCECYWCPSTCQYYYWCEPQACYYPVTYYDAAPCPSPEPAVCATPAPVCAPAPCPPAVEYVTYKVPFVSYQTVAVTRYKTVTVARPAETPACYPAPCSYPTPAPAPCPAPAPSPAGYGNDGPPEGVPAIPQ
jgi:hypothetical protein